MKKTINSLFLSAILLCAICIFVACNPNTNVDTPANVNQSFSRVLTAEPIAISSAESDLNQTNYVILDSYTKQNYNYYLLDVGYIKNLCLSTIIKVNYTGVPLKYSKTNSTTTSYVSSLSENVSKSLTVSDSNQHMVGASVGIDFFATIKGEYQWTGTWTNEETSSKSTSSTVTTSHDYVESQTFDFDLGDSDDKIGFYRYALYSTCDVYFVLTTSRDNQQLIKWEAQVCARPSDYFIASEYTEPGTDFVNESDTTISFDKNFYKSLPIPNINESFDEKRPVPFEKTIRTGETKINKWNNDKRDYVNFDFGLTKNELEKNGYSKISIQLTVDIKESYPTWLSTDLYNGINIEDKAGNSIYEWKITHTGDWRSYILYIDDVSMSKFFVTGSTFRLSIKYYCKKSDFQDWLLGTVKIYISVS